MARPTDYTPELVSLICGRIAEGESLRAVCRDPDMPVTSTVMLWISKYPEFTEQYAKAMEARADAMFDELLEIADDGTNDWMEKKNAEGEIVGWTLNGEHVQRSKLRVDARKWALARMSPRKYGDAVNLKHSGDKENPLVMLLGEISGNVLKPKTDE